MMLVTNLKVEVFNIGVGCHADVIIRRDGETAVVPVHQYYEMKELDYDEINKWIKYFFECCELEYKRHIISDRDREITKDFLKHYPMKKGYHDVEQYYKEDEDTD